MPTQMLSDLTLLLAYLTSWDERLGGVQLRRAWRGYDFETLDALQHAGLVTFSRRSKSLVLTEDGLHRAQQLQAVIGHALPLQQTSTGRLVR